MSAPVVTVAVVNGMGFTAGGIAAGSTAAAMMSAEAVAAGGGIAAGGWVATGQAIGAAGVGAAAMPIIGAIVGIGLIVGGAIGAGVWLACRNNIKAPQEQSGYDPILTNGRWVIATEEGIGNVRVYFFSHETTARIEFHAARTARVLYNPRLEEVDRGGFPHAQHAIRDAVMKSKQQ